MMVWNLLVNTGDSTSARRNPCSSSDQDNTANATTGYWSKVFITNSTPLLKTGFAGSCKASPAFAQIVPQKDKNMRTIAETCRPRPMRIIVTPFLSRRVGDEVPHLRVK